MNNTTIRYLMKIYPVLLVLAATGQGCAGGGATSDDESMNPGLEGAGSESEAESEAEGEAESEGEVGAICSDGIDNDGDGDIDYPADSGCTGPDDRDERNASSGACGNTKDGVPIEYFDLALEEDFSGTNSTGAGNFAGECGGFGSETIFHLTIAEAGTYVASTTSDATTLDTVVYIRTECEEQSAEVACNDQGSEPPASTAVGYLPAGEAFVFVDGWGTVSSGAFVLRVSAMLDDGEACDPEVEDACAPGLLCREDASSPEGTFCLQPVCADGTDDDGDDIADFPLDPGCASPDDDDESDGCLTGTDCPACGDGVDNDEDGNIDFPSDPGCASAADRAELDECIPGVLVTEISDEDTDGVLDGSSNFNATCEPWGGASSSVGEDVYAVQVRMPTTRLAVSVTNAGASTLLTLRTTCDDATSELGCTASGSLTVNDPPLGTYYVIVDGTTAGSYTLHVSGMLAGGAACDSTDTIFTCDSGYTCASSGLCEPTACNDGADNDGDGLTDFPEEPGCANENDTNETDSCPGSGCPQCSDGLDNDGDGAEDWPDDTACSAASDDDESCAIFGSDTWGYQGCSEIASTPPCADISSSGTGLSLGDDGIAAVSIGFSLDFYGTSQSTATVNSNGKVGFPATTTYSNSCLPASDQSSTLFAFWDDLYPPSGGTVTYQTTGVTPNRTFEVQWVLPHITGTTGMIDVRSVFHENGNIDVCYVDTTFGDTTLDHGLSATTGIQGPSSESIQYSCNEGELSDGLVLRYLHPCGTGACVCSDGEDNDDDGLTDFPNDPGCSGINDESEVDPPVAPACFNGSDDDGDGEVDYPDDPGCASASDASEDDRCGEGGPEVFALSADGLASGTTSGSGSESSSNTSSCPDWCYSGEDVYAIRLPGEAASLTFSLCGSSYAATVYARRSDCETGSELGCTAANATCGRPELTLTNVDAGLLYVFVDGNCASGAYTLAATGVLADGESCNPELLWLGCSPGFACQETASGSGMFACLGTECNDGLDNDANGETDFPMDFGCLTREDTVEGGSACSNGADNDVDTKVDYPNDPGCSDPYDNSEADTAVLPACANGTDDDGDGVQDYGADVGCYAASDTSELDECGAGIPYPDLTMVRSATGTTAGGPDLYAPETCAMSSSAADNIYLYRVLSARTVTITLSSLGSGLYDPVLFVRRAPCDTGTEIACNNGLGMGSDSRVVISATPGDYYIFVTGATLTTGSYRLTIEDSL